MGNERIEVITFRIGIEQKGKIKSQAKSVGLDTASFCRNIVLKEIKSEDQVTLNKSK